MNAAIRINYKIMKNIITAEERERILKESEMIGKRLLNTGKPRGLMTSTYINKRGKEDFSTRRFDSYALSFGLNFGFIVRVFYSPSERISDRYYITDMYASNDLSPMNMYSGDTEKSNFFLPETTNHYRFNPKFVIVELYDSVKKDTFRVGVVNGSDVVLIPDMFDYI